MATFEYRALSGAGKMLIGTMEAESRGEVLAHLERVGYTPVSTKETSAKPKLSWRERLTPEPPSEDITGFTLDLAMLLKGGVTLNEALSILAQMESRRWLAKLIRALHVELSGGKSFSQVLAMHPKLFPPIYVKMIEVAETAGKLEEALTSIARERQRAEGLRRRFISALTYPGFLMIASIGVLCFVLLYIIPQFEQAVAGMRDQLDPSARFIFDLSASFRENIDVVGAIVIGALLFFIVLGRLGKGRSLWINLAEKIPGVRQVLFYDLTLTFCRTLAILVMNGVDISTALRLIRGVIRLPSAAEAIDRVIADVRQGKRLSDALKNGDFLPTHVVQMLRVGEESGKLADSADRIGGFYETKLDVALGRITAVMGPVMMILVSLMIAWVIISVVSALMGLNNLAGSGL